MDNAEPFSASTAPLTWHDFLERMRHPSASEFVKSIKTFIVSFSNNPPDPERDSAAVQEFLTNMETAFRAHPLWAGRSEEELDSAGEGLEKYIMTKLYTRVFASHPDDVKVDDELYEKLALVQQFIRPEHLDIQPTYQNETSWLLAQKELQKINLYKAPRDKLVCILSCCKVISNLLFNASTDANESLPGADEFLPVLIYVTIKANPPQLHSNLLYIQRYRRESRLVGEAAYFFTNMLSAESFVMNINGESLSMDETEFQKNMESAQALIYGLSGDYDGGQSQSQSISEPKEVKKENSSTVAVESTNSSTVAVESTTEEPNVKEQPVSKTPSVSDLENKGASMILKDETSIKEFRNFPYFYSRAGDLTVGDVEDLLNSYKQLVLKYVSLAKGLGVPASSSETQNKSVTTDAAEDEGSTGVFSENTESKLGEERAEDKVQ
ncbi:putative VPS9 domain, RABX5, catalytic core helical domain-containing protein [Helianthus annuus]|uniref:VPS9 domain-containing protein n=1 Tax=Helianthus annuus TaxID=4232 RepID=A0A251SGP9_HELAN|nr:vacuolar protein sorting-associated protein 9A [Helianthus annuus]XP_035839361.1 vacuolar protein sorting-associated protein 9A [Helianthus annuus]KAF5770800.1 putative VPS9 domain-containing protein [Helianthus annuus]KAJ0465668.1 putative VPS9 domain, RABX5, catalytic core helical domain-containing protein [Helianthus annuus]KAJ0470541.1 putative VPS9 domain, RABX5, catalytic core helical domain-containing protein [Helianthus annuus]KAJ0487260.1 putative VPS9 domain, RABX5, catalytic core